jgi:hypothetical protein
MADTTPPLAPSALDALPPATRDAIEAAAFRRLVAHLQGRTDVQNIDLMNLAGFCRNCLAKWLRAEAEQAGVALSDPAAREAIHGMPYEVWKARHQQPIAAETASGGGGA